VGNDGGLAGPACGMWSWRWSGRRSRAAQVSISSRGAPAARRTKSQMLRTSRWLVRPERGGIDAADHWGKTSFDLLTALILHELYRARATEGGDLAECRAHALRFAPDSVDELWRTRCGRPASRSPKLGRILVRAC